jgi:transketolase
VKKRLAVEAGVELGWHKYATETVTMSTFGQSAPYEALYKHFGFTTDAVVERAKRMLSQ